MATKRSTKQTKDDGVEYLGRFIAWKARKWESTKTFIIFVETLKSEMNILPPEIV